ncbi:MAG: 1-acyl-sn-glycerol-3-phosphate acyltransferase [Bacteroidetes bacterium]|nr:1-acyl-sn-glycerol-3-phosphate acyltransferase [Bacteroidota bacterium]
MLAYRIYLFFAKRKVALTLLLATIISCCVFFALKLKKEEDITRFIPKDKSARGISDIFNSLKIKDKIAINIYNQDSTETATENIKFSVDTLAQMLQQKFGNSYIKEMRYKIAEEKTADLYEVLYTYLPLFLDEADYILLQNKIQKDSIYQTIQNNYKTLLSPSGMILGKYIKKDPLSITPLVLKKIKNLQYDENFELNDGYIFTKNKKNVLCVITPKVASGDYNANKPFFLYLDSIIPVIEKKHHTVIEYFGTAAVSLSNSEQIKKDSILTSTIAIIAIVLLLFLYFRQILIPIYIILPVAFGAVFSLAVIYLLKGQISAIAMGAGSIVLGIAINYSLHFFTHFKHEDSIERVLKDLTLPMLVGCATTVGAFFSLHFAKSQALHDFGLFAGFSLIGAVLFSILVLPHLLRKNKHNKNKIAEKDSRVSVLENIISYSFHKNKWILFTFCAFTILFFFSSKKVCFESDMNQINYETEKLKTAEQHLNTLNKFSLRSVYVLANGKNIEEALRAHERAVSSLQKLKEKNIVAKYSSITGLLVSDSLQKIRIKRWNDFWTIHKDSVKIYLTSYGEKAHFNQQAFASFFALLDKKFTTTALSENPVLKDLTADWISEHNNTISIVSFLKVSEKIKQTVYKTFENTSQIIVFDKYYLTQKYVELISADFNTILLITGLLVFVAMLLNHGRIELAIINFLPMLITWVWILGIMGLAGIKFNIINIIISTFIFGLGDDYSIFIMDGLSSEYKYGRKNLSSYKSSIFLSALITTIGLGVLLFAKHPALKSIALITIIGMVTVVFISFIVQPLLYNALILNRTKEKKPPITAKNFFMIWLGFFIFFFGSFVIRWGGAFIFKLYPGNKSQKKLRFHVLFMNTCKFIIYFFTNVKKNIINKEAETFSKPAVIVCNHQSFIDLALLPTLFPKMTMFTKVSVQKSFFFGKIVRMADFYPSDWGAEQSIDKIREQMKDGYSVVVFPEGTRSTTGNILRFHKGAFFLAEKLQADIIPIVLHGADYCLPKNDFYYRESQLTLKILPRIQPGQTDYRTVAKNTRALMQQELNDTKAQVENTLFYRPELIRNYIYKGCVLEWYCRIKTKLENNYKQFDEIIPKEGKIIDVGCGYGFLSLMLSLTGRNRTILGIDYDEDKILIANNCVSKPNHLRYLCADVTSYPFESADVFIISDVLHYLSAAEQEALIERCIHKLNKNGVLIIRDGDASLLDKHRFTKLTEFFSTKIFNFNKTNQKLNFFPSSMVVNMINKHTFLSYQKIHDSSITSNYIFVIKKSASI